MRGSCCGSFCPEFDLEPSAVKAAAEVSLATTQDSSRESEDTSQVLSKRLRERPSGCLRKHQCDMKEEVIVVDSHKVLGSYRIWCASRQRAIRGPNLEEYLRTFCLEQHTPMHIVQAVSHASCRCTSGFLSLSPCSLDAEGLGLEVLGGLPMRGWALEFRV